MESLTLVEGQTLLHDGRLRFLRRIGCGTFALILRALDIQRGCAVAVKCMQRPEYNAIGEQEAAVLRQIGACDPDAHCAVVRLLDTFVEQGVFCLILELLGDAVLDVLRWGPWRQPYQEHTLRSPASARRHKLLSMVGASASAPVALQSRRSEPPSADAAPNCPSTAPLPLDDVRQIAVHLCGALAFLHSQRLIHADLKPENIVRSLSSSARASVKLIDFGNCIDERKVALFLASAHSRSSGGRVKHESTAASIISGDSGDDGGFDVQTLAYRAPEVAAGLALSSAIDMWSLGCVLLECASGEPLFTTSLAVFGADRITGAETENDVILRQIELLVADGRPLSAVTGAYRAAVCYSERRGNRVQARDHDSESLAATLQSPQSRGAVAFAPLRERLDALAPVDGAFHDFITRLLDVDPVSRLTARGALLHPFVQAFFPFKLVFASALAAPPPSATATVKHALVAVTNGTATHAAAHQKSQPLQQQGVAKRRDSRGSVTVDGRGKEGVRATITKSKKLRTVPPSRETMARAHVASLRAALKLIPASAKKTS